MAYGLLGQIYASQRKLNEARIEFEEVAKRLPKVGGAADDGRHAPRAAEQQGGGEALV